MVHMIRLKRVYEQPAQDDGTRILVERLWPRGLTKESAKIDYWFKDIAPSPELRKWYSHDIARWEEFTERYALELQQNPEIDRLQQLILEKGLVTFVFATQDIYHSSARLLMDYLLNIK